MTVTGVDVLVPPLSSDATAVNAYVPASDAFHVMVTCGGGQGRMGGNRPPAPGRYELSLELFDPNPIVLPLGTLVVGADQEMTLTPP